MHLIRTHIIIIIIKEEFVSFFRCLQTDSWRIVSAGDDKTLKVFTVKSVASPLVIIDPFMVFSTFDMDTLGKVFLHHWKEHCKVSTLAKFKSDSYVLSEWRYSSTELHKFTDVCMVGGSNLPPTIQTSVNFHNFEELHLWLFSANHFQTWWFFSLFKDAGSMDFPKPVHVKSWTKPWRGLSWPRGQKPEIREMWLLGIKSFFFSWLTFRGIAAYINPPGLRRYALLVFCWFHWWPRTRISVLLHRLN